MPGRGLRSVGNRREGYSVKLPYLSGVTLIVHMSTSTKLKVKPAVAETCICHRLINDGNESLVSVQKAKFKLS